MATHTAWNAFKVWFDDAWTATPRVFENETTAPLRDANGAPAPYVVVEMESATSGQKSVGAGSAAANVWRERGEILFHVYVPSGSGTAIARQHAESIMLLLRGLRLSPAIEVTRDISIDYGAPDERDGSLYVLTVAAEWLREF